MVYFVCKDIVESFSKADDINHDNAAIVMSQLVLAAHNGKHCMIFEDFNTDRIKDILKSNLNPHAFRCFDHSNTTLGRSILSIVELILVISFKKTDRIKRSSWYRDQRLLIVNPSMGNNLELDEETRLITEHINDGKIFGAIYMRYIKSKSVKGLTIKYFNRNGGGSSVKSVYNQEKELRTHLCLTIVDSDKKYPDGKIGSTASELEASIDQNWQYSKHYVMKHVSEVENLIPRQLIKEKSKPHPRLKALAHSDICFFDMKLGLIAKYLKNNDCYTYWTSNGVVLPSYEHILNLRDDQQIIPGVGSNLLSKFLLRKRFEDDIKGTSKDRLSSGQYLEYQAIGNLLFNWCIAVPPPRL